MAPNQKGEERCLKNSLQIRQPSNAGGQACLVLTWTRSWPLSPNWVMPDRQCERSCGFWTTSNGGLNARAWQSSIWRSRWLTSSWRNDDATDVEAGGRDEGKVTAFRICGGR